jgi:AcrR family transcriptional regulator
MTPRAPKATEEEIFAAVALATSRIGPDRMTLDDVAREVGVTPSALVQRFGSKRDLILAAVRHWNEEGDDPVAALRSRNDSALATLFDYAACVAGSVADPEVTANQLAMLQLDVADAEFRAESARFFVSERDTLRGWLEEAIADGAVSRDADPVRLAGVIQASLAGWRILWSIVREGSPEDAARDILGGVLGPHLM